MDHKEPFRSKYVHRDLQHPQRNMSVLSVVALSCHLSRWLATREHTNEEQSTTICERMGQYWEWQITSSLRHLSFSKRTWKYFWLNIIDRIPVLKEQYYSTLIQFPSKEHEKYKTPEHESPGTRVCFIHSLQRERDKFTNFVKERLVLPNVFLLTV